MREKTLGTTTPRGTCSPNYSLSKNVVFWDGQGEGLPWGSGLSTHIYISLSRLHAGGMTFRLETNDEQPIALSF